MTPPADLHTLIASLEQAHPHIDAKELTALVLATPATRGQLETLVFPAVYDVIRNRRRTAGRSQERRSLREMARPPAPGSLRTKAQRLQALFSVTSDVALPDGRVVPFQKATSEEFKARALEIIQPMINGLSETKEILLLAANELDSSGAKNLTELRQRLEASEKGLEASEKRSA